MIAIDNQPIVLQELLCDPNQNTTSSCYGEALAQIYVNVPGIVTFHASTSPYPGPSDVIRGVEFTTTPEPVSAELALIGMTAMLAFGAYRRRRTAVRYSRSLVLLSLGSLSLFLSSVAARADPISTLTTTSVTYCHCGGVNIHQRVWYSHP